MRLLFLFLVVPFPAYADDITCSGALVNINQPHGDPPLGIVFDDSGEFSCSVDRRGAKHDPLKSCIAGYRCRISGSYVANGRTYNMDEIKSAGAIK